MKRSKMLKASDSKPTRSDDDATAVDAAPALTYPYGGWALVIAFLGAQVVSSIVYGIVRANSSWDFDTPAGIGASIGQAAGQSTTGQALAISVPPPVWATALMQLPLWLGLAGIPMWFAWKKGRGIVSDLVLRMRAIDVPLGLVIGVAAQLVMVPLIYWVMSPLIGTHDVSASARALTDRATDPASIVLVFLIVGLGAPVAEEIYFRGMAQTIFARRLAPMWAIAAAAAFFAASHLDPLLFPPLLVFGVILGVLRWRYDRLGPAIWAHVGFNLTTAYVLLFP